MPSDNIKRYARKMETALHEADRQLGGGLVKIARIGQGQAFFSNATSSQQGDQFVSVMAELIPADQRSITNDQLLNRWRKMLSEPAGLEALNLTTREGGYTARDFEVQLSGKNAEQIKAALNELAQTLAGIPGLYGIEDNMPYGKQQLLFSVNDFGQAHGLTAAEIARQMSDAFDGHLAQIFIDGEDELEVRVMLPNQERDYLSVLPDFRIRLPQGGAIALSSVVRFKQSRGFKSLKHEEGELSAKLFADIDHSQTNADQLRAELANKVLPQLAAKYSLEWKYSGSAKEQQETAADMQQGGLIALAIIYIVLAWVFASYSWPLLVMAIIPFGIVGALLGHWLMGIDMTILSIFGVFGLSGIIMNDSIILVIFYKQLRKKGLEINQAVIEASCERLRAVVLTSLTTIAGLTPLLFETSFQAKFLVPMATSLAFGLIMASVMVLILVPVLLANYDRLRQAKPLNKLTKAYYGDYQWLKMKFNGVQKAA